MKSGYDIDWTDEAINNVASIEDYLTNKWTDKEIRNFYKKLDRQLNLIKRNPFSFQSSELKTSVRRCVLSAKATIYFEVKIDRVIILSVFDNSRDLASIILLSVSKKK